ncbi:MAG: hypothetical protein ACRCYY_05635 [Trueperaceae bacterium]
MTPEQLQQLKVRVERHAGDIEGMLEDYSLFVNNEQARFIHSYVYSLKLDFENAMTRGEETELVLIVGDLEELQSDTALRLKEILNKTHEA